MSRPSSVTLSAALLLLCLGVATRAVPARDGAAGPQAPATAKPADQQAAKQKKPPSAKLADPWPDAAKLAERRVEAEKRQLFQSEEQFPFTLKADFKAVNRERTPESTKRFPATLTVAGPDGKDVTIPVSLGTRGKSRLNPRTCSFVPLRVDFPKKELLKGTLFDGQESLKLITHCENEDSQDQYILLEQLTYRIFNVLTPRSFRARLARATYVDSGNDKAIATRNAVFVEDDGDLARRLEGRSVALPRLQFKDLDRDSLVLMMLFQYMIGNTDFSIYALHNVRFVTTPAKVFYPVVWDFDMAGLVSAPYAAPAQVLGLGSVRDRLYRGPCLTQDQYAPYLDVFRAKQAEVMAAVDSQPGLDEQRRRTAKAFLDRFYVTLGRPGDVKKEFVDRCRAQPTM